MHVGCPRGPAGASLCLLGDFGNSQSALSGREHDLACVEIEHRLYVSD